MSINLRAFEYSLVGIKFSSKSSEELQKRLRLAELQVHLKDGNYNWKMVQEAIDLAKQLGEETKDYQEHLRQLRAAGKEEVGSRGRLLILDELMELIKQEVLAHNRFSDLDYDTALARLEWKLDRTSYRKGESGYDDLIKFTWVNLREEMFNSKYRHLNLRTAEFGPISQSVLSPSFQERDR